MPLLKAEGSREGGEGGGAGGRCEMDGRVKGDVIESGCVLLVAAPGGGDVLLLPPLLPLLAPSLVRMG